jgi:hypothetical protein
MNIAIPDFISVNQYFQPDKLARKNRNTQSIFFLYIWQIISLCVVCPLKAQQPMHFIADHQSV